MEKKIKIQLSSAKHREINPFDTTAIRDSYTASGASGLSPWNEASCKYSVLQTNLAYNPISVVEVVSMLNINNISIYLFHYHDNNRPAKYNPKLYLGAQTSYANAYLTNYVNGKHLSLSTWPESLYLSILTLVL